MDIALGQVVNSKAGRDKEKSFIVIEIINEDYILLSDGSLRKIEKPKKKKIKHVMPTEIIVEPIGEKLRNGSKVTNSEIRRVLSGIEGGQNDKEKNK